MTGRPPNGCLSAAPAGELGRSAAETQMECPVEAAQDCPKCGLVNPPNALRCDCGWDFVSGRQSNSLIKSGIVIVRANDCVGVLRKMKVLIDGQDAGAIRYGGELELPLPSGIYSVQVAMDWCISEPCQVQICEGQTVKLEGGLRRRGMRGWVWSLSAIFSMPSQVFEVRRVQSVTS